MIAYLALLAGIAIGALLGSLWWSSSILFGLPPMGEEQFVALIVMSIALTQVLAGVLWATQD